MKQIKVLAISITILLLVSAFSAAFTNTGFSSAPITEPVGIDDNVKDVKIDLQITEPLGGVSSYYSVSADYNPYWHIGDSAYWLRYGSGYAS